MIKTKKLPKDKTKIITQTLGWNENILDGDFESLNHRENILFSAGLPHPLIPSPEGEGNFFERLKHWLSAFYSPSPLDEGEDI